MSNDISTIPNEIIINKILLIRGKKVMLDSDLARLYQVETRDLNKAVKRNIDRFPPDFRFMLTKDEFDDLMFQSGTSSLEHGGRRKLPSVFTEQGVAMLSSVLHSSRAIQMNIQIIRTFTKLREIFSENRKLAEKVEKLERKYDKHIYEIFQIIKRLTIEEEKPKERIGFRRDGE